MVVFYECCVGVGCQYMPFWGVGEVRKSDDQCVGPYVIEVVVLGMGKYVIACVY